jgi:transmembrane sensor
MTSLPTEDPETFARNEAASLWCLRLSEAALSAHDQDAFEGWILEDVRNREAFEAISLLWQGMDAKADTPELIRMRADALDALGKNNRRRWSFPHWSSRGPGHRYWLGLAVAATLLLLVTTGLGLFGRAGERYETGIGERRVVALSDGSRVSLDAATRVDVDYGEDGRTLKLVRGRAKFDVAHDASRPFTVSAGDRVVIATGTSFSVELLQRQMRVILYQGKVAVLDGKPASNARELRLAGGGGAADHALKPGSELVAYEDRPEAEILAADIDRSLSWESGQLNFRDEPLAAAVERMNRYSDRRLVVEDPESRALLVDGVFSAGDAESFAEGVAAVLPLRVEKRGKDLIFYPRPGV